MDAADPLNISKSMVTIRIQLKDEDPEDIVHRAGVIIECDVNWVYIIAEGNAFVDVKQADRIIVFFKEVGGLHAQQFCVDKGFAGIYCNISGVVDVNAVKKIKICDQPLKMCQAVYVYEGLGNSITPGNITRLYEGGFSHNCAANEFAEHGAPVINQKGEMVGICCSLHYHLNAISVSALVGTIESMRTTLLNLTNKC